jgi:hypothetical protein
MFDRRHRDWHRWCFDRHTIVIIFTVIMMRVSRRIARRLWFAWLSSHVRLLRRNFPTGSMRVSLR